MVRIALLRCGRIGAAISRLATDDEAIARANFSGMRREGGVEGVRDYLDTKMAQVVF